MSTLPRTHAHSQHLQERTPAQTHAPNHPSPTHDYGVERGIWATGNWDGGGGSTARAETRTHGTRTRAQYQYAVSHARITAQSRGARSACGWTSRCSAGASVGGRGESRWRAGRVMARCGIGAWAARSYEHKAGERGRACTRTGGQGQGRPVRPRTAVVATFDRRVGGRAGAGVGVDAVNGSAKAVALGSVCCQGEADHRGGLARSWAVACVRVQASAGIGAGSGGDQRRPSRSGKKKTHSFATRDECGGERDERGRTRVNTLVFAETVKGRVLSTAASEICEILGADDSEPTPKYVLAHIAQLRIIAHRIIIDIQAKEQADQQTSSNAPSTSASAGTNANANANANAKKSTVKKAPRKPRNDTGFWFEVDKLFAELTEVHGVEYKGRGWEKWEDDVIKADGDIFTGVSEFPGEAPFSFMDDDEE
ncbi:hypothetical protein FRC09_016051 [Ceratobasidium sp. 395]|nr:hypothetical protein FRC09_016051 [Ceratobasidium sp. 395]